MSLLDGMFEVANRLFPARVAYAHCDIPCGIYDPHLAQIAALTIIRMNQLIEALPKPGPSSSPEEREAFISKLSRYISVKEHHAELCKQELRVLWGDYFKPEHLQQHPDLHDLFWDSMRLASKARQEIGMAAAQDLLAKVQRIAEVFWQTKGTGSRRQPSLQAAGGELVYPVAQG